MSNDRTLTSKKRFSNDVLFELLLTMARGYSTETGREALIQAAYTVRTASETDPSLSKCFDAFSIGSAVRTPSTLLANILNAKRRSDCLDAIEREFFTDIVEDDEGDHNPECVLSWGAEPAEYVKQFRAALAERATPSKADGSGS